MLPCNYFTLNAWKLKLLDDQFLHGVVLLSIFAELPKIQNIDITATKKRFIYTPGKEKKQCMYHIQWGKHLAEAELQENKENIPEYFLGQNHYWDPTAKLYAWKWIQVRFTKVLNIRVMKSFLLISRYISDFWLSNWDKLKDLCYTLVGCHQPMTANNKKYK